MCNTFLRKQVKWTESCYSSSAETAHPESKQFASERAAEKCLVSASQVGLQGRWVLTTAQDGDCQKAKVTLYC